MRTPRQQEFLNAAINIVAEHGFSRLTIRNVAAAVGVTEPAVYRHFASKLDLLSAMLEDLQTAIQPHFSGLTEAGRKPETILEKFIHGIFDELKARPAFAPFIFSEELFHTEPQMKSMMALMMKKNLKVLSESFRRLQEQGCFRNDIPAEEMAVVTMGSIRLSISRWHLDEGKLRLKDLSSILTATLGILFASPKKTEPYKQ